MTTEFKVSDERINDCKEAFKLFDKKGNGRISLKELTNVFRSLGLGLKPDQLKEWAEDLDEDGSGYIDFEEFLPLFTRKLKEDEDEKELREAFRVLDKGSRGVIDVKDLRWLLKSIAGNDLSEEDIEDMITETDTDNSGTVDYEEFYKLMNST